MKVTDKDSLVSGRPTLDSWHAVGGFILFGGG